jgi:asparagine synthetase B (glutamine-hydrolysing)
MSGIAGIIRIGDLSLLEQMTAVMAYCGPDNASLYFAG